jgi:protein TonB
MLESSLFESHAPKKTRKPVTVFVSVTAHVVTIGALALIPLFQTQALTLPRVDMSLFLPRIEPQPVQVFTARRNGGGPASNDVGILKTPPVIPTTIPLIDEPQQPDQAFPISGTGNRSSSLLEMLGTRTEEVTAPTPPSPPPSTPPPPPPLVKASPIRQGGNVQAANLIHQVNPAYPPLARQARIQGKVVLEAMISKDGSIESLRVISGHPFLSAAALEAVKQWKYRPTILNGEPVEVTTEVTVTFTLQ